MMLLVFWASLLVLSQCVRMSRDSDAEDDVPVLSSVAAPKTVERSDSSSDASLIKDGAIRPRSIRHDSNRKRGRMFRESRINRLPPNAHKSASTSVPEGGDQYLSIRTALFINKDIATLPFDALEQYLHILNASKLAMRKERCILAPLLQFRIHELSKISIKSYIQSEVLASITQFHLTDCKHVIIPLSADGVSLGIIAADIGNRILVYYPTLGTDAERQSSQDQGGSFLHEELLNVAATVLDGEQVITIACNNHGIESTELGKFRYQLALGFMEFDDDEISQCVSDIIVDYPSWTAYVCKDVTGAARSADMGVYAAMLIAALVNDAPLAVVNRDMIPLFRETIIATLKYGIFDNSFFDKLLVSRPGVSVRDTTTS